MLISEHVASATAEERSIPTAGNVAARRRQDREMRSRTLLPPSVKLSTNSKALLLSAIATMCYAAPAASTSAPSNNWPISDVDAVRLAAGVRPATGLQCESRPGWGIPRGREECATMLPRSVTESQDWLVAAHVDRAPTVAKTSRLRGGGRSQPTSRHRELPHLYFDLTMEATLHTISEVDPRARVDLVVFSEGRWGQMVDETGVPIDWDISSEMCEDLGLECTQTLVLINNPATSIPDALECIAAADVFLSSENEFSQAAVTLSTNVKIVTDQWEVDEQDAREEDVVVFNPATTVAGMSASKRAQLRRVVTDWRECSLAAQSSD